MLRLTLLTVFVLGTALSAQSDDSARLLRFPHCHAGHVVFTKGGDLWIAQLADGVARRLTSYDEGYEIFGRISPDGTLVAFSGEYSGTRQVFVVPIAGGTPRQLTFYPDVGPLPPRGGYDNLVLDWTPDGRHVLVRSNRTPYGERIGRYFLVPVDGRGLERPLPIPEGGPATFSPDGTELTYNAISREWRTWKRYTAGRAQDVWTWDLEASSVRRLTDFAGTDNWPMWVDDRIYFTSDRNGTLNLWCHELASGTTRAVTGFQDYDVLFPARGDAGVVFEKGGDLWLMERGTEAVRRLEITLADDEPWTRPRWKDGASSFGDFTPSPDAERAIVEFRGDLFAVPRKDGEARNLTETPSRRERDPTWSPDGRRVAFLAEHGDDYELFVRGLTTGEEVRLTEDSGAWILGAAWAPNGSRIACTDNAARLWIVDVANRERTELDTGSEDVIGGVQWSHDGRWLCYTKRAPNGYRSIWLARVDGDDPPVQVTSDDWDDDWPTFDPNGRYLYFVSSRDYRYSPTQSFEDRIYALLLRDDVANPTAVRPDAGRSTGKAAEASADDDLRIDLTGIGDREVVLPIDAGRYFRLLGVEGGLLYQSGGQLWRYDVEDRESKSVLEGISGFNLTPDGSHLLYRHRGNLCFASPKPGQSAGKDPLPTDRIRLRVHPPTEWSQMYGDAWRIMRDFFYDPDMHGVDWVAMREKYAPLVPHVAHRADLDFLIGELIGELNCGHTYVQPGETPEVTREQAGVLGCELEPADGRYRIARIFDGENWRESMRNPLTEPGVDVDEGDYLLAIDGRELTADDNPYRFLEGKVGRVVELTVNDRPHVFGARTVRIRPVASEVELRYLTWVNRNRAIVDELSGGRIGYLHVPNTAIDGHRELFEGWRAQARVKDAMIIDDRYNGGGFVPDDMAFDIGKPVLNWWSLRHRELAPEPQYAFEGPRVMLINGYSSSGGDAFPYYFRELGLGTLMGQRTWGGLVGYSGTPRLVDGGGLAVPNFAFVNRHGEWDVEAYGVEPDVEVFDDPTLIQAGREPMLEAAVALLLRQLEERSPGARPAVPAGPDRSGLVDPGDAPRRRERDR